MSLFKCLCWSRKVTSSFKLCETQKLVWLLDRRNWSYSCCWQIRCWKRLV